MVDVSVIIINYNTDALTLQAVSSVFKYVRDVDFEIIVVDNNSGKTNLSGELSKFKNTYFYKLPKNIGFGNANNFGFSKSKGDFVFLLNSDAHLINETTISTFIHYLKEHPEAACVGGNLMNENGNPNISYGNFLSVERILYDYGLKKVTKDYLKEHLATSKICDFEQPTPVDYLTGAALMIKRKVIEEFGLFNNRYFMYFEDMDLCFRYKKKGFLSVLLPDVKIVHIGGESRKSDPKWNKRISKEVEYSKYLFLQNVTIWPVAFGLFILGKYIRLFKRIKNKIKRIVS